MSVARKLSWGHNKLQESDQLLASGLGAPTAYVHAVCSGEHESPVHSIPASHQQLIHGSIVKAAGQVEVEQLRLGPMVPDDAPTSCPRPASTTLQRSPYSNTHSKAKIPMKRPTSAMPASFIGSMPGRAEEGGVEARALQAWANDPTPDTAACVKTAKDQALRDVLCSLLGSGAVHVDNYRLDVATIKELCDQRAQEAAAAARQEVAVQQARAVHLAVEAAEREWQAKASKELATVKTMADSEQQHLRQQLDQSRREVAALTAAKRDLLAKAGQQGRDKREAEKGLQVNQDRIAALEKQLAGCKASLSAAERWKQEADRSAHESQKAAAAAQAKLMEAQDKLQAVQGEHAKQLAAHQADMKQVEARWKSSTQQVAQAALAEEQAASITALTAVLQELCTLQAEMQSTRCDVEQQLHAAHGELHQLQTFLAGLLQQLRTSSTALQAEVSQQAAAAQDTCSTLVQQVQARVDAMLSMDAHLASLGPEGLDGLCLEMQQARQKLAESSERCSQLSSELAASEQARQALLLQQKLQEAELAMTMRGKSELQRELVVSRDEVSRMSDRLAVLQAKAVEQAADQTAQHAKLSHALGEARDKAKQSDKQVLELTQQLAGRDQQIEELQSKLGQLQQQVEELEAEKDCLTHKATSRTAQRCADLLKQLRRTYFIPVGSPSYARFDGREAASAAAARGQSSSSQVASQSSNSSVGSHAESTGSHSIISQVLHDAEEVVGLGLCALTHHQVMQAFDSYSARQLAVAQASVAGTDEASQHPSSSGMMDPVKHELLWMEGCLLLMMVQLRQQERELKQQELERKQQQEEEPGPVATAPAAASPSASSTLNKPAAQPQTAPQTADRLVAQLLRALADDKRKLQRQVTGQSRPASPGPASFLSYIPLRRSLSARPTVSRTSTPLPHSACSAPAPDNTISLTHQPEALLPQHDTGTQCSAVPDPNRCSTQAMQGIMSLQPANQGHPHGSPGPSNDDTLTGSRLQGRGSAPVVQHGCLSGITPRQIIRTNSLSRPALSSLDDEVIQILQCLDASELRSSRGMSGLCAGANKGQSKAQAASSSGAPGCLTPALAGGSPAKAASAGHTLTSRKHRS